MHNSMKIFAPERVRAIGFVFALALGAALAVVIASDSAAAPIPAWLLLGAGAALILVVMILAGLDLPTAGASAAGAVAVAVVVALAIVLTSEPGWAQSSLDSIVSGVEGKGNEVVSAGRRIAVIGLNIVFIAMGIAAMMRKISWGWFGLAVLGAILVNFSGQFSSWLGNFGGGLIPGLPGI